MNKKCLIRYFLPLALGKREKMQVITVAGWVGGGLWAHSPSDTFRTQRGRQKGNTENQRHLVATGTLF